METGESIGSLSIALFCKAPFLRADCLLRRFQQHQRATRGLWISNVSMQLKREGEHLRQTKFIFWALPPASPRYNSIHKAQAIVD